MMAYVTKTLSCYKFVKPSFVFNLSNALRVAAHQPYSCYCIVNSSYIHPKWSVKDFPIYSQLLRSYAKIETLDRQEIENRVMESIRNFDKLEKVEFTKSSHLLKDLGLDSLDHVELVMAVEEEFGDEIPDVDAEKLMTPQDIIDYIARLYIVDAPTSK